MHWTRLDLPRGSYCWSEGGQGACADAAPIDDLIRTGYVKPYRTAGGFSAQLTFSSPPTDYSIDLVRSPAGAPHRVAHLQPEFSLPASPPAQPGIYVYRISGKWSPGTVDFYLAVDLIAGTA